MCIKLKKVAKNVLVVRMVAVADMTTSKAVPVGAKNTNKGNPLD